MIYKLLLFLTLLNFVVVGQTATLPSGDGSVGNPYLIATLDNLYWITQNSTAWSAYFEQTADIDASSSSSWDGSLGFTPIGLTGSYDGNGHTITGLFINRTSYVGMFGYASGAVIKNIGLINVNITNSGTGGYVGGLVAYMSNSTSVSNSYSTGSVNGGSYASGLVGSNSSSTISSSYSTCSVSGGNYCSGLVGNNSGTISNSYSTGSVNGSGTGYEGGLVGFNSGTISNSYSTGSVIGSGIFPSGGLIGYNGFTVSNCFWDRTTSGKMNGMGGGTTSGVTGKNTADMKTETTFTSAGWNFTTVWQIFGTNYPNLRNNSDPALPVELTTFSVKKNENNVELNWQTATEVNNYGFEVERKILKQVQNDSWEKVAFIEGHGNSNSPKHYSFADKSIEASGKYLYRLKQVDIDGTFEYSDEVEINLGSPNNFELAQNYPNPFNPTTSISYSIPNDARVTLAIYDVLGNRVTILENSHKSAGTYSYSFDASNLTSGIYFYTVKAGSFTSTKKMLLMK